MRFLGLKHLSSNGHGEIIGGNMGDLEAVSPLNMVFHNVYKGGSPKGDSDSWLFSCLSFLRNDKKKLLPPWIRSVCF